MPDPNPGMSAALESPAPLRRCPGCHNQVTAQTQRCPVCGQHAATARLTSALRWIVITAGVVGLIWWWCHHG